MSHTHWQFSVLTHAMLDPCHTKKTVHKTHLETVVCSFRVHILRFNLFVPPIFLAFFFQKHIRSIRSSSIHPPNRRKLPSTQPGAAFWDSWPVAKRAFCCRYESKGTLGLGWCFLLLCFSLGKERETWDPQKTCFGGSFFCFLRFWDLCLYLLVLVWFLYCLFGGKARSLFFFKDFYTIWWYRHQKLFLNGWLSHLNGRSTGGGHRVDIWCIGVKHGPCHIILQTETRHICWQGCMTMKIFKLRAVILHHLDKTW